MGKRFMAVDEYVTPSPYVVKPATPILDVLEIMRAHDIRHVPVVAGDCPIGIISDRDMRSLAHARDVDGILAEDVMTEHPYCVTAGTSLETVAFDMAARKIGSALVVESRHVVGIFTATDALNALVEVLRASNP